MMQRVTFTKSEAHMTVKELKRKIEGKEMTFDNAVQRGVVWDNDRKSFLIDSILQGYEVPSLYAKRTESGVYDMLDGKQRSTAIFQFINNEFALTGMSEQFEDFEDMYFDQLDEEMKDAILDFQIAIKYFDGISDDEVKELFFRLNNGKPLTNFEQIKAKCKSLSVVQRIANTSNIFTKTEKGQKMTEERRMEMIYKIWAMIYVDEPSFEKKNLNPIMLETVIDENMEKEIVSILERIYDCSVWLSEHSTKETEKQYKKVITRILTPTHLISMSPFILRLIDDGVSVERTSYWLKSFYSGTRRASTDDKYNDNASRGSAKASSIQKRNECLSRSFDVFFDEVDAEEDEE